MKTSLCANARAMMREGHGPSEALMAAHEMKHGGITAAERHALPASDFAGSAKDESYPDDTIGRARNALSRVSQFGSSSLQAKVRAKVRHDWPSIGEK
jgi:hypothetical protein